MKIEVVGILGKFFHVLHRSCVLVRLLALSALRACFCGRHLVLLGLAVTWRCPAFLALRPGVLAAGAAARQRCHDDLLGRRAHWHRLDDGFSLLAACVVCARLVRDLLCATGACACQTARVVLRLLGCEARHDGVGLALRPFRLPALVVRHVEAGVGLPLVVRDGDARVVQRLPQLVPRDLEELVVPH